VWIPPGEWEDGWTGEAISGPKTITVSPTESEGKFNIPLWHKRGSLLVLVSDGKLRINSQDWSELTIEAFPATARATETREIFEQDDSGHADHVGTTVGLATDGSGKVVVSVSASAVARSWVVRVHLQPNQRLRLTAAPAAGAAPAAVVAGSFHHLEPACAGAAVERRSRGDNDGSRSGSDAGHADHHPFGGKGVRPPCMAGPVAEFTLVSSTEARAVEATLF
jgi:hypothetical protein